MVNIDNSKSYTIHIIAFAIISALLMLFNAAGDNTGVLGTIISTVAGLSVVFFGLIILKKIGLGSLQGKSILVLMIANFLWLVADLTWVTVNKGAVVSFSDIFWLLGYPLIFFGILFGIQDFVGNIFKDKRRVIVAIVLMLIFGTVYFIFFPLTWNPEMSDLENLVSVGYVLGDLFLIIPLIFLVCMSFGERFSVSWLMIGLSAVISLFDDMQYTFNPDGYLSGSWTNILTISEYLLFALAFIYMKKDSDSPVIDTPVINTSRPEPVSEQKTQEMSTEPIAKVEVKKPRKSSSKKKSKKKI